MNISLALLALFCVLPFTFSIHVIHYTSYGGICRDECGYHGYGYTWCKQSGGSGKAWDYCSLEEGLDSYGKKCVSACDLWGGSYRYCHLANGGWNYCGLIGRSDFLEYSIANNICIKHCHVTKGAFTCETVFGIQSCSPFHDITTSGFPCHTYHRCAIYNDPSIYNCHIDENGEKWGYCGQKGLDVCVWVTYESNSQVEVCSLSDSIKGRKIIFRRKRRDNMLPPTTEEFRKAVHLIDKIRSVSIHPDPGPEETLHFYKQKDISCKGTNYTNLELHIKPTKPVAHVVFPASLNSDHLLRLAFYTSLNSTFYQPAYTIAVSFDEPMSCSTDRQ